MVAAEINDQTPDVKIKVRKPLRPSGANSAPHKQRRHSEAKTVTTTPNPSDLNATKVSTPRTIVTTIK